MMLFLIFLILSQENEILLKKRPSLLYPLITKEKKEIPLMRGDTLYIQDYWWSPDDKFYVTDISPTGYAILSFDWNIDDTIFWYYYYPDNDTITGEPTGEYPLGVYGYITYNYENPEECVSSWKYWALSIWDNETLEGLHVKSGDTACATLDDLTPGFSLALVPANILYGKLVFTPVSFFPGKWYVEIYKRRAGGNKVFLKKDSCVLQDTFTYINIIFPSDTDTVYGTENIILGIHENHWANIKLHITSTPGKGKNVDTMIEFHVFRMQEEKGKSIPFDFGSIEGQIYMITAHIEDFSGNTDDDTAFAIVGRPIIELTLNPDEVLPDSISDMPPYGNRTEVIVKVTSPSGKPISGYSVNLRAKPVPWSGGHDHNSSKPVGNFEQNSGETNKNGEFRTYYYANEIGGVERIIAYGENPQDSGYSELTVRVPGLILLPDYPDYIKIGGTSNHHGPPGWEEDHNHWCLDFVVAAIYYMAEEYRDRGGERIYINDLSLPYGGLFDINGNWQPPHHEHRVGNNADISGEGPGGRFLRENIMLYIVRPRVEEMLGLIIEWLYEPHKNHYHFYFFQTGRKGGKK